MAAEVQLLPGELAARTALLGLIDRLLPPAGLDPARLARPVRVVVPSRSVRLDVVAALARHRGRAVVGLVVQTLAGLVAELLAAAGHAPCHGDPVLDVLTRRRAADQPHLQQLLGGLQDGLLAAAGPVAHLLDAGFDAARDAVPLATMLRALPPAAASDDERLRALALVQVAGQVQQDLQAAGLGRHADGLRQAAALLGDGAVTVPCAHLVLYGLVDPTPAELGLVDALARCCAPTILLAAPADLGTLVVGPAPPGADLGPVRRLVERLGGVATAGPATSAPPRLRLVQAPGQAAEARQVARSIQSLLAGGARPESIAVVVRDLATWSPRLRPELERLGLPWSGVGGQAPPGPALRQLRALLDLLGRRGDCALDRWLDAAVRLPGLGRTPTEDLRTALRSLGRVRLAEVADLDLDALLGDATSLPLPVRAGLQAAEADDDGPVAAAAVQRRVPARALHAARQAAADLLDALEDTGPRPLVQWTDALRRLASRHLGWGDPDAAWRALLAALDGLVERVSPGLVVDADEARILLGPALAGAAAGPVGGAGGGVQLLSAREALGRTFDHLFVLGLSRGELPRSTRPDPLLPDHLRLRLRALLPDLPLASEQLEQERRLLCHLLTAAPELTLSWPATDDDGRVVPPSPLVEQLRLARPDLAPLRLPPLGSRQDPPADLAELPRPAGEHARYRALHGPDDQVAVDLLAAALGPGRPGGPPPGAVAAARTAIRRELDAPPERLGAGPYLGFVGGLGSGADPRAGALYITTLEAVAACGWQAFLTRVLRIEPPPDPGGALPAVDSRLVGSVVHRVLEQVGRRALPAEGGDRPDPSLADLVELAGQPAPWPLAEAVERLVAEAARDLARQEGLALPGTWRILAARARPYLEVARAHDWADGPPLVLAVEVEGLAWVEAPGGQRAVRFRADRVDAAPSGGLRLTDYKTGKPLSSAKAGARRDAHLLAQVAAGRRLQAALYARVLPGRAQGRYLALRPDGLPAEAPQREAAVPGAEVGADEFGAALDQAAGTAIAAWERGALVPRLVTAADSTPQDCAWCQVRAACLQGDSTARLRQAAWARSTTGADDGEAAALALWWLGQGGPSDEEGQP